MTHTQDLAKDLGNDFIYTKAGTCITTRWRKLGWIPASEQPEIKQKWEMYQSLPSRQLDAS